MATASELNLEPGNLVFWAFAQIKRPDVHITVSIDTPGAEVTISAGKVLKVNDRETLLEVLWSNDHLEYIGRNRTIHSGFVNFFSEGDKSMRKKLEHAGIGIMMRTNIETNEVTYGIYTLNRKKEFEY